MAIASFQDCLNCAANPNVKTLGTTNQKQANVLLSILLLSDKRRCHVMRRVQALLKAVIRLTITLQCELWQSLQMCKYAWILKIATLSVCMRVCVCVSISACAFKRIMLNAKHILLLCRGLRSRDNQGRRISQRWLESWEPRHDPCATSRSAQEHPKDSLWSAHHAPVAGVCLFLCSFTVFQPLFVHLYLSFPLWLNNVLIISNILN
jgi:hypothetical protein